MKSKLLIPVTLAMVMGFTGLSASAANLYSDASNQTVVSSVARPGSPQHAGPAKMFQLRDKAGG